MPCGRVSFRAKLARRHRLDARDLYPEEMGVTARLPGEGRIADANHANAKWVDGELLVFAPSSSGGAAARAITGGARLGFVWSVPGERRFLILLNRVRLEAGGGYDE